MNTRRKIFSAVLALMFIACMVLPCMQEKVWAAEEEFTIDDEKSYETLKSGLNHGVNSGGVKFDDAAKKITVDFEKITYVYKRENWRQVNLSQEAQEFINKLFEEAGNLEKIYFENVNLENIDFSKLDNKASLKTFEVTYGGLTSIPNIHLPNLECLVLSKNNFSADGACANLDSAHFPVLEKVYLDGCGISKMGVISGLGSNLTVLSLADNRLTDDALDALIEMKDKFPNLQEFNIGSAVHVIDNETESPSNSNKITNMKKIVSLLTIFPELKKMDLSRLEITSLQDFSGIADDVKINFDLNKITDFAGLDANSKISLHNQMITIYGNYAPGQEGELPELLKRILDQNDSLYGSNVEYYRCQLSDDGTKLSINPNVDSARIAVYSGKLWMSSITIRWKEIPQYEIPQNLTATVGDTLATVTLPAGFAWKNAAQDVGAEGTNTFAAVYTPQDTDKYVIVDVDIPVTVTKPKEKNTLKITTQPQDITLTEGGEGTLTVMASGSGALSYQWYKDDALINGASSSSLTLSNAVLADAGSYKVKVTDQNGSITSESAVVTVKEKASTGTEDSKPAEPEPNKPSEPASEPNKPSEPASEPNNPVEPSKPSEPTNPVEPTAASSDEYDEDNEDETEETQVVAAVKTSDTSPVVPVMVLLLVSGMALCITVLDKKNDYIKK